MTEYLGYVFATIFTTLAVFLIVAVVGAAKVVFREGK